MPYTPQGNRATGTRICALRVPRARTRAHGIVRPSIVTFTNRRLRNRRRHQHARRYPRGCRTSSPARRGTVTPCRARCTTCPGAPGAPFCPFCPVLPVLPVLAVLAGRAGLAVLTRLAVLARCAVADVGDRVGRVDRRGRVGQRRDLGLVVGPAIHDDHLDAAEFAVVARRLGHDTSTSGPHKVVGFRSGAQGSRGSGGSVANAEPAGMSRNAATSAARYFMGAPNR